MHTAIAGERALQDVAAQVARIKILITGHRQGATRTVTKLAPTTETAGH